MRRREFITLLGESSPLDRLLRTRGSPREAAATDTRGIYESALEAIR